MPATPESRFSQRVRTSLPDCFIERLENRVNLGVPDMLIGIGDRFVLVELKVVTRGLKVALRPHQVAFLVRHSTAGRPCFVLVKWEGTTTRPDTIRLYRGEDAIALSGTGLRHPALFEWTSRAMDWQHLRHLLSGSDLQ
jgi:hypothetical protein